MENRENLGSWCQVAGASCPVGGEICYVPGSNTKVAGAKCQVKGHVCMVPGGRGADGNSKCRQLGCRCQVPGDQCQLPGIRKPYKEEIKPVVFHFGIIVHPAGGGSCYRR